MRQLSKAGGGLRKYYYIIIVSSLLIGILFTVMPVIDKKAHSFGTQKWKKSEDQRVFIVDDLLGNHPLIGKTKAEVIGLLGPPTDTDYFKEANNIVYYLGDERSYISIDSEWLVITFRQNPERVEKVEILRD
jgi:hypothetical protein